MQSKTTTQTIQHKINIKTQQYICSQNKFRSLHQRTSKIFMFDNHNTISTNYNMRRQVSSLLA